MAKRDIEKEREFYDQESKKLRNQINSIAFVLFVCIISLLVGGIVVLYNNQKKAKEISTIVSYEDGVELNKIIDKLDMLDLINKDYNKLTDEEFLILVASMTEQTEDDSYRVEDLNKTANKYFNRDIKIVKFNCFGCEYELYIYDEATNSYIMNPEHPGHGDGFTRDVYNIYFSSKRDNNTYYITVLKAFSSGDEVGCGDTAYYDSLTESNKVIDVNYNMETCELNTDIDKEINSNKGKLNKYTYTFEKVDDKFILKSLEAE